MTARRRRRYLIGVAIALLLVLGFFAARPARNAVKAWQARRHADKAFALIRAEKWNDATREARAAYQLHPGEPAAIRAVARLLTRTHQPEALGFWKVLREKQPLTRPDLRDEASAALLAGEVTVAQRAVEELFGNKGGGPGAADYLVAAQVAAQNGRPEEASALLGKAVAAKNAGGRELLEASILQLALGGGAHPTPAKEIQTAAWSRLSNLARGHDQVALDALAVLAQQSLSSPNEIVRDPAIMPEEELVLALTNHPFSRISQKLLALDIEMHADPVKREGLISQAIASWQNGDNETLAVLARWLNGKGEFQRELDTVPLAHALQTRDLFLQRLDALGALGQWAEVKRLLTNDAFPLDPVIERMYLARCNQQLNEVTAAENNWQRAFEAAAGEPQKLLVLAEYAEKNGATKTAELSYDTIAREAPHLRAAQQGRLRLAQQNRDTSKIHGILFEMLKQWPNDTAIQNDEAYLRLLLAGGKDEGRRQREEVVGATTAVASSSVGEKGALASNPSEISPVSSQLSEISGLAENLVGREPASLPHRTLLALARLRAGEPAKALEVYKNIRVAPNAASPSAIAVHAAVLAANGQISDARTEASALKGDQLLPEERELLEKLP